MFKIVTWSGDKLQSSDENTEIGLGHENGVVYKIGKDE